MQNNIFNSINVSSRILILFILIFSLMLTNSICFILMFSIFVLILLILNDKSVKCYIYLLKNIKFLLLFIFIAYIIMVGKIFSAILVLYKIILLILLIKTFLNGVNFQTLTNGIKTILKPFENKLKIDNISLNMSLFIYFLVYYINSNEIIMLRYSNTKFNLIKNILVRLYFTNYKLKKLESDLKLKFYSPKFEINNRKSNIVVYCFILLLILVIFKEVVS